MTTTVRTDPSVDELTELAREHAADADATGTPAPAVIEALRSAGLPRHLVAARWGGSEGSFAALTRSIIAVGEVCPATAWLASVAASSSRCASHLPLEGQATIWRESPDVLIATGLVPSGRAVATGAGWKLTGRWSYVSGIDFADWVLVCAPAGDEPAELRFFAVPRGHFDVQRTWDSIGMRATGTHTVLIDEFVPAYLSFPREELVSGQNSVSAAACHNIPFRAIGGLVFVTPVAGAVTGALRAATRMLAAKSRASSAGLALVRCSARADTVRMLVEHTALLLDSGPVTPDTAARTQRDAVFAAELGAEALNELMRASGTSGFSAAEPIQRFWRDVVSMASHAALRFETSSVRTSLPLLLRNC